MVSDKRPVFERILFLKKYKFQLSALLLRFSPFSVKIIGFVDFSVDLFVKNIGFVYFSVDLFVKNIGFVAGAATA